MSIESLNQPDIDLKSLSDEDRAELNQTLLLMVQKINEILNIVNTEHP